MLLAGRIYSTKRYQHWTRNDSKRWNDALVGTPTVW